MMFVCNAVIVDGHETDSLELSFDSLDYVMYEFDAVHNTIPDSIVCNQIHRRLAHRQLKAFSLQYEYHINRNNNPILDKILIIVSDTILENMPNYIIRYAHDIHKEYGCETLICSVNDGGTYSDIKSIITSNSTDLNGCVLIGDIIEAQYHLDTVTIYGRTYRPDTWPCDLYYMDINGTWTDSNSDGIFDGHSGHVMPEIFIGRISTHNYGTEEFSKLKDFFDKDHRYWLGKKQLNKKYALSFTEKDWCNSNDWTTSVKYLYGNQYYDTIGNYGFTLSNYQNALSNQKYEFLHMACHSNAEEHQFIRSIGAIKDTNYYKISFFDTIAKQPIGYNLFCCSACRWTATYVSKQCLGEMYIYDNSEALCVLGTTKTGGMRFNRKFYKPLGNGDCIGQAYLSWWRNHCNILHNKVRKHRYYGLCILGDPLVSFHYESNCADELTLNNGMETDNASYYAEEKINVRNYSVTDGKNVLMGAPRIEITGPFVCDASSSMVATAKGCVCYQPDTRNNISSRHLSKTQDVRDSDDSKSFSVFPNPTRSIIFIESPKVISNIIIYSLSGQPVLQTTKTEIDVSSLPSGIYIVRAITVDGEQLQAKFIKQ